MMSLSWKPFYPNDSNRKSTPGISSIKIFAFSSVVIHRLNMPRKTLLVYFWISIILAWLTCSSSSWEAFSLVSRITALILLTSLSKRLRQRHLGSSVNLRSPFIFKATLTAPASLNSMLINKNHLKSLLRIWFLSSTKFSGSQRLINDENAFFEEPSKAY